MRASYQTNPTETEISSIEPTDRSASEANCRSEAVKASAPKIAIIDDDVANCEALRASLEDHGYSVECFSDGPAFLSCEADGHPDCLLIDAHMPNMTGIEVLRQLKSRAIVVPVVIMSRFATVPSAVQAMKAGAVDVIEKPVSSKLLFAAVRAAIERAAFLSVRSRFRDAAARRISTLTKRQHEILNRVVAGHASKNIAADLHISQRTVENHRAAIARKTCSNSLSALIQTALCARCSFQAQRPVEQAEPQPSCSVTLYTAPPIRAMRSALDVSTPMRAAQDSQLQPLSARHQAINR